MPGFDFKKYAAAHADMQQQDPARGGFDFKGYADQAGGGGDTLEGAGQAFGEHAANAATLGYLPHLQALAEPAMTKFADLVTGNDVYSTLPGYTARRDENIKRIDQQAKEHPIVSRTGDVAGVVGGALMTGGIGALTKAPAGAGLLMRGLNAAKNAGRVVGSGAAIAAAQNPGDVEGEVDPLQLDKRYENAKTGAIISGVLHAGVNAVPIVKGAVKWGGAKVAAALTGEADDVIRNYAARTDQVNKMIEQSGGDITVAADQLRDKIAKGLQATKDKLNGQITQALASAPRDKTISVQPLLDKLEAIRTKLNPNIKSDAVSEINEMMGKLIKEADEHGNVSIQSLHEIKSYLQEAGKSAYAKGGQIFSRAKEAARAAKDAAAEARKIFNGLAPDAAKANNQLAMLHGIEDRLNKNLITSGKSDAALMAAGSGANPRNARMLGQLEQASGVPVVQPAKDLASVKAFGSPSLLPKDATGKALARQAAGAGIGTWIAGPIGTVIGGALTSPMTLKLGINAANLAGKAGAKVAQVINLPAFSGLYDKSPAAAQFVAQAVGAKIRGQGGLTPAPLDSSDDPDVQQFFEKHPQLLENIQDNKLRAKIEAKLKRSPSADTAVSRRLKSPKSR
jgi:hypothetical protein